MNGYLELADGALIGARDGLTLGRVAACDVVVDDTKASRRHARLVVESGVVEIEDMNSSNGTLLNGKPVDRRMLRDGDEIRIGKTVIVYREGQLPGSRSKSSSSQAVVFDDDDDLLGGDDLAADSAPPAQPAPAAAKPPAPAVPPPSPSPPPRAREPEPALPSPPPPASRASGSVVEFEDEVVEVQKAPAVDPVVEPRVTARASASKTAAKDDGVVASSQRVLQYSKKAGGSGLLGDDLGQMSAGMRALLVVGVIALGAAIIWAVMTFMQG